MELLDLVIVRRVLRAAVVFAAGAVGWPFAATAADEAAATESTPQASAPDPGVSRKERFEAIRAPELGVHALEAASAALEQDQYEKALAIVDALPEGVAGEAALRNARGAALVQLERHEEAAAEFAAALEQSPNFFPARFNVGELLFLQKDYAAAATHYRVMLVENAGVPLLKFKLYLCYLLGDQPDRAASVFREIKFPIDGPAWYFSRAASELVDGDAGEAADLVRAGQTIHSDDAHSYVESLRDAELLK